MQFPLTLKSWKTFDETIRRKRNRSIKAWLVTDDEDYDGYDDLKVR
jgi:hypothetical protein